ncbi:tetratricopeptide repeat protein [Treponema sp.]|uniref:tetratricopeptide repeat protein n=1 Tax=Treponema sp. TaxID=166 RepID=UPI0038904251
MKKVFALALSVFVSCSAFAVDVSLRVTPGLVMPSENYETGFMGIVQGDLDLFGFMTAGVEGLFSTVKPEGVSESLNIYGGGLGLGAYFYPLSRLYLGVGGSYGIYSFSTKLNGETKNASDMYYRGYGEVGFRFNPTVTVNAVGGYNSFNISDNDPLLKGMFAGIGTKINFSTGKKSSGGFSVSLEQTDAAFPIYMSAYRNFPIGTLTIRNTEGADVTDVHVSFRAGKYTASTYKSAVIPKLRKYKTVQVPLLADFSQEILRFTEDGKILGEVVIEYNFLGSKKESVHSVVLDVYNRNAFMWADPAAMASFISPDTPEIQEFAKYVAGFARNNFKTGINRNLVIAAHMSEAVRLSKISIEKDESSPYEEYHRQMTVDSIKYPLQTMNMMGGDLDEIGILLASCLESVGVGTGYIPLDDDMIVLVDMGIKPTGAGNNFTDTSGLIIDSEKVYFGISVKSLPKGFTRARKDAFNTIKKILSDKEALLEFYDTHSLWEVYSPSVYTGSTGIFTRPSQSQIEKAAVASVDEYINTEIEGVIVNARKSGDPNKIGMALVRVGRYSEAKNEFAKSNSIQAMNNLANVYLLEKNYNAARAQFERVLAKDPENKTAKKGVEKCKSF